MPVRKAGSLVATITLAALAGCGGHTSQHAHTTASGKAAHSSTFGLPPKGVTVPRQLPAGATTTVEMFDSISVSTVPSTARAVAGYTSGLWPTFNGLVAAFPHAYHVPISISTSSPIVAGPGGRQCLDVEPGDAVPSQAGPWAHARLAAHVTPCIYANLSEMPAVRSSLAASGASRPRTLLWLALWTFHPGLVAGYDAVQWTDKALGRNLDESTVTDGFLGIKQPQPQPAPQPQTVCFGKRYNAKHHAKVCDSIRPKVSNWSHARDASKRVDNWAVGVLKGYHCQRPYRRPTCVSAGKVDRTMRWRVSYFGRKVEAALKQYG